VLILVNFFSWFACIYFIFPLGGKEEKRNRGKLEQHQIEGEEVKSESSDRRGWLVRSHSYRTHTKTSTEIDEEANRTMWSSTTRM